MSKKNTPKKEAGAAASSSPSRSQMPSGNDFKEVWAYAYRERGSNATLQEVFLHMESMGVQLSPEVRARIQAERESRSELLNAPGSAGNANQDYWESERGQNGKSLLVE